MTKDDFLAEGRKAVKEINCSDANKAFECSEFIFLDCRTEKELKKGSVPKALHLARGLLEFKIAKAIPHKNEKSLLTVKQVAGASWPTTTSREWGTKM